MTNDPPEYRIESRETEGILELAITGRVTAANAEALNGEALSVSSASSCRKRLWDVRGVEGRLGMMDAYYRAKRMPIGISAKVAVVDRPEHAAYQHFLETASRNAGKQWRWFTDIDAARAWLINDD